MSVTKKNYRIVNNFDSLRILDNTNLCVVSITPEGISCPSLKVVTPDEDDGGNPQALYAYFDVSKVNDEGASLTTFDTDYKVWHFDNEGDDAISFQWTVPSVWKEGSDPILVMMARTTDTNTGTLTWTLKYTVYTTASTTPHTLNGIATVMPATGGSNVELRLHAIDLSTATHPCSVYGYLLLTSATHGIEMLSLGFDVEVDKFGLLKPT